MHTLSPVFGRTDGKFFGQEEEANCHDIYTKFGLMHTEGHGQPVKKE